MVLPTKQLGRGQGRAIGTFPSTIRLPTAFLHHNPKQEPTPPSSNSVVNALGSLSLAGGTAFVYTSLLNHPSSTMTHLSFVFMMLLAAQYALQPRLSRKYISPQLNKQSVALVEEVVKTGMAAVVFAAKPQAVVQSSLQGTSNMFHLFSGMDAVVLYGTVWYCMVWYDLSFNTFIFIAIVALVRLDHFIFFGRSWTSCCVLCLTRSAAVRFTSESRSCHIQWFDANENIKCRTLLLVDHGYQAISYPNSSIGNIICFSTCLSRLRTNKEYSTGSDRSYGWWYGGGGGGEETTGRLVSAWSFAMLGSCIFEWSSWGIVTKRIAVNGHHRPGSILVYC